MYCQNCGNEIVSDSMFCSSCGTPVNNSTDSKTQTTKNDIQNLNKSGFDTPKSKKSPLTASILTFIIFGLGQVYNGQTGKGILFFFIMLFVIIVSAGILAIPIFLYGLYDAYKTAENSLIA